MVSAKPLLVAGKVVITIVLVVVINRAVNFQSVGSALPSPLMLAVLVALLALSILLQTVRWRLLLRWGGVAVSGRAALRSLLMGNVLGLITPGRVGEFGRASLLGGVPHRRGMGLVLVEKGVAALTVLAALLLPVPLLAGVNPPVLPLNLPVIPLCVGIGSAALCLLLLFPWLATRGMFGRLSPLPQRQGWSIVGLSLAVHLILVVQGMLLLLPVVPILRGLVVAAGSLGLMQCFPVTVANLGTREFCFGYMGKTLGGVAPESGGILSLSLTLLSVNILLPSLIGLFVLLHARRAEPAKSA